MPRKLVWVDENRFRGFACSECSWRFDSSAAPTGKSFDEMMGNFELQRDKEFTSSHPMFAPITREPWAQNAQFKSTIPNDRCLKTQSLEDSKRRKNA
jgi:hypothetical protein